MLYYCSIIVVEFTTILKQATTEYKMNQTSTYENTNLLKISEYGIDFYIMEAHSGTSTEEISRAAEIFATDDRSKGVSEVLVRFRDENYKITADFYLLDANGELDGGVYFSALIFDAFQREEEEI